MSRTHGTLAELFSDIADAIREKTGSSASIIADNFPDEIEDISTGTDVSDTTAVASDVLSGKDFYLANGTKTTGTIVKQTKSATPSTSSQTISPDSGKLLEAVNISAIQTQTKSATPTENAQTITPDSGKFLSSVNVGAIPATYKRFRYTTLSTSTSNAYSCSSNTGQTSVTLYCISISNLGFTPKVILCTSTSEPLIRSVWDERSNSHAVYYEGSNYWAIPPDQITKTSSSVVFPCGRTSGSFYVAILG